MEDINVICQNTCKVKGLNKHQAHIQVEGPKDPSGWRTKHGGLDQETILQNWVQGLCIFEFYFLFYFLLIRVFYFLFSNELIVWEKISILDVFNENTKMCQYKDLDN